ncbi:hypothetical protein CNMCM5793_003600 [Aspergillus hiratsukae]|uniref:Carrier domain-containing protein n=1 Tax=Aspergillus hiratsukae TaxID=1194566 RepID=A0A8H6QH28_9EURO|nr:hypothetical protein CNMCM5793_003600 [Aspergillus hiratsukae]KAF7171816.1 hypothetical protein CNMCM6106_006165 [Aspergillus hiratsukae]
MTVEEHKRSSTEVEDFSIFPSLNGGEEIESGRWRTLPLPHPARSAIASVGGDSPAVLLRTLMALWGVLLRRYTDVQYAQIWTCGAGVPQKNRGGCLLQRWLMATSLDDALIFRSLLDTEQWSVLGSGSENPSNTGVLLMQTAEDVNPVAEVCDLFWTVQTPSGLESPAIQLFYRAGFLSDDSAATVMQQMETLASAVGYDTGQSIRQLSCPTQRDLDQFVEWNSEPLQRAAVPMHVRIREISTATPDNPAVHASDGILTYLQLDRLASQAADQLIAAGVGPGVLVPICFSKTLWGVVAMVAINRAGGAFVPIDPALQTKQQQRDIIHELGATVAVCERAYAAELLGAVKKVVVLCDETIPLAAASGKARDLPPRTSVLQKGPAHLLFTSGSTGKPKGCVVSQSAFAGIVAHAPKLRITPASRVLQFSSWTFAIAIIEVFCTLGVGGTVCIPSDDDRRDCLPQAMADLRVDWAMITPTVLRTLTPGGVPSLATMVLAGEPPHPTQLRLWAASVHLMVAYGLSEWSGIFSVSERVVPGKLDKGHIGRPVNGKAWIVDPKDYHRLLPMGSTGELVISGPNLADGYLGLPDRTAAVFVPPPQWALRSTQETARYYKTGDLARYDLNGSLVHCGRKDNQTKVRGIRVDLPSIEVAVLQHFPLARESLADVIPASSGTPNNRLVVFVVQEGDLCAGTLPEDEVLCAPTSGFIAQVNVTKQRLQESLPSFMVPSIFFPLHRIPRTRTGKTDRNRLRLLVGSLSPEEWLRYSSDAPFPQKGSDELRSPAEVTLSRIWARLLEIPDHRIGADSDFIALGGDSVLAMRVAEMARTAGFSLGVQDILTFPRLSDLAVRAYSIEEALRDQDCPSSLVADALKHACVAEARKKWTLSDDAHVVDVLPATGMQSMYVYHGGLDSFCFYMPRAVDLDRLREACRAVVRRHAALRTIFTQTDAGLFQIVLRELDPPMHCIETSEDLSTFRERFCFSGPDPALHLDRPTVGFTWASGPKGQYAFLVQLSHCQHDGLSIPVLFQDLSVAYSEPRMAPTTSFGDYLYYRASPGRVRAASEFWIRYLKGASVSMPETQARPGPGSENRPVMASVVLPLPSRQPTGVTLGTVVRAAWAYVLSKSTASTDVVFGQVVSSRSLPLNGIDQVLGPCNNIIPCRVRWSSAWTVQKYLERVHHDYIQAVQYDYAELDQVLKTATAWPPGTRIGTIFAHQNVDSDWAVTFDHVRSSSCVSYRMLRQTSDIWVMSFPYSPSELDLRVIAAESLLTESECNCLAQQLADVVRIFLETPQVALSSVEIRLGKSPEKTV